MSTSAMVEKKGNGCRNPFRKLMKWMSTSVSEKTKKKVMKRMSTSVSGICETNFDICFIKNKKTKETDLEIRFLKS